jgi:hypothetical protein
MPRLTIENLTAGVFTVQDPSGLDGFSMSVAASATETEDLSDIAFAAIEQDLVDAAAASMITWSVEDDPDILADSIPHSTSLAGESLGTPTLADNNYFLISTVMLATAYTLDETTLPVGDPPRNVIITHTTDTTTDTLGNAVVTGTDYNDEVITETLTVAADSTVVGTKAFKTITSVVTASWVQAGGVSDTIEVGFDTLLGLARKLSAASQVFMTTVAGVTVLPSAIAVDADVISENTVDLSGATYDGSKEIRAIYSGSGV